MVDWSDQIVCRTHVVAIRTETRDAHAAAIAVNVKQLKCVSNIVFVVVVVGACALLVRLA